MGGTEELNWRVGEAELSLAHHRGSFAYLKSEEAMVLQWIRRLWGSASNVADADASEPEKSNSLTSDSKASVNIGPANGNDDDWNSLAGGFGSGSARLVFRNMDDDATPSEGRYLTKHDIGKVFTASFDDSIVPHPNFGKYKILRSIRDELYGFDTFDLVGNRPVGKLSVSHHVAASYRPADLSRELVAEAVLACQTRLVQLAAETAAFQKEAAARQEDLRTKYGKPQEWCHIASGSLPGGMEQFVEWLDVTNEAFAIELYREGTCLALMRKKWLVEPTFGTDVHDHHELHGPGGVLATLVARCQSGESGDLGYWNDQGESQRPEIPLSKSDLPRACLYLKSRPS